MNIKIEIIGGTLRVESPYNQEFVKFARQTSGRWRSLAWLFDVREEDRVREACMAIYGCDGIKSDLVSLRCEWRRDQFARTSPVTLEGRPLFTARGRDSGARVEAGVVLLEGVATSDGSIKNWCTVVREGTVAIVRDVPRALAERCVAASVDPNHPRGFQIEPESRSGQTEVLRSERERLVARVADIDRLLLLGTAVLSPAN
jgi:hypothetical protein